MVTCHHHFGQENRIFLATKSVLWLKICRKCDSGQGSAPDPAGEAHDAPPDHLVGWGADTPPHTPPHSAPLVPRCSRLRRLDRRPTPPDTKSWRRHWSPPVFKAKLRQRWRASLTSSSAVASSRVLIRELNWAEQRCSAMQRSAVRWLWTVL